MSRQYTTEEVREMFLDHVRFMVRYWRDTPLNRKNENRSDLHQRLDGLAFSIMAAIDGSSASLPMFILASNPHPEDKQYHQGEGENWFPENHQNEDDICADIAGCLHDNFYKK